MPQPDVWKRHSHPIPINVGYGKLLILFVTLIGQEARASVHESQGLAGDRTHLPRTRAQSYEKPQCKQNECSLAQTTRCCAVTDTRLEHSVNLKSCSAWNTKLIRVVCFSGATSSSLRLLSNLSGISSMQGPKFILKDAGRCCKMPRDVKAWTSYRWQNSRPPAE